MRRSKNPDLPEIEGMTMQEIAAREGVSYQRVFQILHSAYRKLRRDPYAIAMLGAWAEICEARRAAARTWADDGADA